MLERRDEGVLDVPDRTVAARFRPDPDALGQPADQTVFPDTLQQPVVGRRRQFRRRPADRAGERVLSARFEKLGQRKRAEVRELDAADGERMLLQREVEQRTGRHDMQRRHLLAEIPQGLERARTQLDLVKEQKRLAGPDVRSCEKLQLPADADGIQIRFEDGTPSLGELEVDFAKPAWKAPGCKFADAPGLARLAHAADDERLAVRLRRPFLQNSREIAFHRRISIRNGVDSIISL